MFANNFFLLTLLPGNLFAGKCKLIHFPVELAIHVPNFPKQYTCWNCWRNCPEYSDI